MDASTVLAAAPWAKKAWKLIPAPMRVPLLVVALVVWLWKRKADREEQLATA